MSRIIWNSGVIECALLLFFPDSEMNTRVSAIFPTNDGLLNGRTNRSSPCMGLLLVIRAHVHLQFDCVLVRGFVCVSVIIVVIWLPNVIIVV